MAALSPFEGPSALQCKAGVITLSDGNFSLLVQSEWNGAAWDLYQKKMLIDIYVQTWITLNISHSI